MKSFVFSFLKGIFSIVAICVLLVGVSACEKEGTFEKAGKEADKAIEQTTEAVSESAQAAKDAVGEAVEETGKKIDEGAQAAKDTLDKGVEKTADAVRSAADTVEKKVKE